MRRVLLGLAAALSLAVPAEGAGRSCRLVTDLLGDDSLGVAGVDVPYGDRNLDIVSADVASNQSTLAVAVRAAGLEARDPTAPSGRGYLVEFDVRSAAPPFWTLHIFFTYLERPAGPPRIEWGVMVFDMYLAIGPAPGTLDVQRDEVRMWLPLRGDTRRFGDGRAVIGNLRARSYRHVGEPTGKVRDPTGGGLSQLPYLTVESDSAYGAAVYRGGTPSCLPVGR